MNVFAYAKRCFPHEAAHIIFKSLVLFCQLNGHPHPVQYQRILKCDHQTVNRHASHHMTKIMVRASTAQSMWKLVQLHLLGIQIILLNLSWAVRVTWLFRFLFLLTSNLKAVHLARNRQRFQHASITHIKVTSRLPLTSDFDNVNFYRAFWLKFFLLFEGANIKRHTHHKTGEPKLSTFNISIYNFSK